MQYKWVALTVTTVGALIAGMDSRILVVGLPTIAHQLKAGPQEVVWISQSFLLASTVILLLVGRLTDLFGRVKLFSLGFLIFTIGSVLAVLSPNPYALISFRFVQGLGAGMILAIGSVIVTDASPPGQLGMMLGINQTAIRVGSITGLTISGLILSISDWRGLFYISVPLGIFGTVWSQRRLREISRSEESRKMDWLGFGFVSSGIVLVLLAITFLSYGASGLMNGIEFLSVGTVLLVFFVVTETRVSNPLLDLRLFKVKLFAAANFAQLVNSLAWASLLVMFAFYLQIGLGYTPFQSGIGILPLEGTYVITALASSRLSDRYGTRLLCTTGLTIVTLCFLLMTSFGSHTPYSIVAIVLAIIGVGNGMFTSPNLKAIMGSVPVNRRGVASGFRQTMFNAGSTSGYGLVILFMTFGIPYSIFSPLIQGTISQAAAVAAAKIDFFNGFRIASLLFAVLEAIAIVPSAMRGGETSGAKDEWPPASERIPPAD